MAKIYDANPVEDPFGFAQELLVSVFWGSPRAQMVSSLVAATGAYISAAFSFGATAILVVLFTITFFVGFARYVAGVVTG